MFLTPQQYEINQICVSSISTTLSPDNRVTTHISQWKKQYQKGSLPLEIQ